MNSGLVRFSSQETEMHRPDEYLTKIIRNKYPKYQVTFKPPLNIVYNNSYHLLAAYYAQHCAKHCRCILSESLPQLCQVGSLMPSSQMKKVKLKAWAAHISNKSHTEVLEPGFSPMSADAISRSKTLSFYLHLHPSNSPVSPLSEY